MVWYSMLNRFSRTRSDAEIKLLTVGLAYAAQAASCLLCLVRLEAFDAKLGICGSSQVAVC